MSDPSDLNAHSSLVRLQAYADLSPPELSGMLSLISEPIALAKGASVQDEGEKPSGVYLLLEGWTASSVIVTDGKRQILKVHLPGDLIGLPSLSVTEAPDTVVALTDAKVGHIDLQALWRIFQNHPRIAVMLFLISQEERVMLMDRLALVGSRDAAGRLAGMLLQLHARMLRQDPSIGDTLRFPLTQADLADMIGVTTIHLNRTLMELRDKGILSWSKGETRLLDKPALRALAGLPERTLARAHGSLSLN